MRPQWNGQYDELLKSLEECRGKFFDNIAYIECCFLASLISAEELIKNVSKEEFINVEEEIYFFKTVKPQFESRVEYYRLLYQAELFKPEAGVLYLKEFWRHELDKLPRFIRNHIQFYEYYKSGNRNYDHIYFVRSNAKEDEPETKILDGHYDHLVARIIALEDYQKYVRQQLKILN